MFVLSCDLKTRWKICFDGSIHTADMVYVWPSATHFVPAVSMVPDRLDKKAKVTGHYYTLTATTEEGEGYSWANDLKNADTVKIFQNIF